MKISIIGPGIMPIPPIGWGAVESLIWDYYEELSLLGHEVQIVNTQNLQEIVNSVNGFDPDFVHLQYDDLHHVLRYINCKNKAATSHFGYIENQMHTHGYYNHIFRGFVEGDFNIFCLSEGIKNVYLSAGVNPNRLYVTPNGARVDLFKYIDSPVITDKSIYLAKIQHRKRQYVYHTIDCIDFVGNREDAKFNYSIPNYLGEWTKHQLYENLSTYPNLVLLSDGEAHALVCCEALINGLGLVISEYAVGNLDTSLPFITVIPKERLDDLEYVKAAIIENRKVSIAHRSQIREYGIEMFSWKNVVPKYVSIIESIIT